MENLNKLLNKKENLVKINNLLKIAKDYKMVNYIPELYIEMNSESKTIIFSVLSGTFFESLIFKSEEITQNLLFKIYASSIKKIENITITNDELKINDITYKPELHNEFLKKQKGLCETFKTRYNNKELLEVTVDKETLERLTQNIDYELTLFINTENKLVYIADNNIFGAIVPLTKKFNINF
jgi:hypothetical protein